MARPFSQVDVFASDAWSGNPLAVVHDADGLNTEQMAAFANWTNLSETTFLLPPEHADADYRVRIFTVESELPFAGHPTLGSCQAWLEAGGTPRRPDRIVQECGAGLVPLRRSGDQLAFAAPPMVRSGPLAPEETAAHASALDIPLERVVDAQWVDNGPGWAALLLASADDVLAARSPGSVSERLALGLVGRHGVGSAAAFEVRAFFSDATGVVREDPVTGSLNASVAQWLLANGLAEAPYTARQGTAIGRAGLVSIDVDGADVWVGGRADVVLRGHVEI